ncbi:MAG: tetratricopeptide repeat protein [Chloroflexota bacterium]
MHQLVPQFILNQISQQQSSGELVAVCLFVDTSGFTPLTTALMRYGKVGAEVLAQALGDVFEPLVQTVYTHGGFIAGFAGDAFKAIFPLGDAGETAVYARAFAAAAHIRQHMMQHKTHTTRYGSFDLVVKLSMAAGIVTWNVWPPVEEAASSTHSETRTQRHVYTFAGPALGQCLDADANAQAGNIVLTKGMYESLLPLVALEVERVNEAYVRVLAIGEWQPSQPTHKGAGHLRMLGKVASEDASPSALEQAKSLETTSLETISNLHSLFFPNHLLNLSLKGEFRQVVTMFVNIQGLPEGKETADFQRQLFRLLGQYGGYLCRVGQIGDLDQGATLLLFWGAPTGHENDVLRALNFILDLRVACPAPLRAGVTTNLAFAGFVGGQQREEYTCYGSYVTLAARHMVTAAWGEIWLDEETVRLGDQQFETEEKGKRPFKGFAQPRAVFELLGRRIMTATAFYSRQMAGRWAELEKIQAALQPVWEKKFGGSITIIGEAGIGKSRLIHEVGEQFEHPTAKPIWLLCQTDEIIRQSLNPFRYMLRHYFAQDDGKTASENKRQFSSRINALAIRIRDHQIRAELQRTYSFLGALLNLTWPNSLYEKLEPELRAENIQAALKNFIKALSQHRPVIIHLEDAHWLDEESRTFLRFLTRNVAEFPFALLISSRDSLPAEVFAPQIPNLELLLQPLTADALGQMATEFLQEPISPTLSPLLLEKTDGNPFFLEQLLLYWRENDHFRPSPAGLILQETAEAVPSDVRQVLTARLDRLVQEVKEVVQAASVLGREFEYQVLSQLLLGDEALPFKVQQAEVETIWRAIATTRYLFHHALLRDAAYDMQLQAHLRQLHQRAAAAITAVFAPDLAPHAADLAYHYDRADETEKAGYWYYEAGKRAVEAYANEEAVRYLSHAIRLTPETRRGHLYQLVLAREQLYHRLGKREEEAKDLARLTALAKGDLERETAVAVRQSDYAEATSDYPAAVAAAQTVLRLAQNQYDVAAEAAGHLRLSRALLGQGNYLEALETLQTALRLSRQIGDLRGEANVLSELGKVYFERGEYGQAKTYYEQALPMHRRIGNQRGEHLTLKSLGSIFLYQGDYAQAQQQYELGLSICREIGDRRGEGMLITNLGGVYHYQGQYKKSLDYYEQDLNICREIGDRLGEGICLLNLGLLHHDMALFANVLTYSKEAQAVIKEVGSRFIEGYVHSVLGHGYAGLRVWETAVFHYSTALTIRRELEQPYLAMDSLAGLARVAYARDNFTLAQTHISEILAYQAENPRLDGVEEPVRVLLICYRVLLAVGDVERGTAVLQTAHDLLQERAAKISNAALRQSFLENIAAHREVVGFYKTLAS